MARWAGRAPDSMAVTVYERAKPVASITRRDLHDRVQRTAAALAGRLAPGDRVLLPFHQGIDVLVAFLGTLGAGGIAVPTEAPGRSSSLERFERLIDDARPSLILTTAVPKEAIARRLADPALPVVTMEELHAGPAGVPRPEAPPDEIAFLQYTSGSTAAPRGVRITHGNLVANLAMIHECFQAREEEVVVSWLPFFHDMGLIGMMLFSVRYGHPLHLLTPLDFMKNPAWWMQVIASARGTITAAPNFAYDHCVRRVTAAQREDLDLSSVRVMVNGAETVRPETLARFEAAFVPHGFDPAAWMPSYGLAEATLAVSAGPSPARRPTVTRGGRVLIGNGRPPAGVEVRFRTDGIVRAGEDHVGEILVHSASVSPGYWRAGEGVDAELAITVDGRRFLRTGDIGFMRHGEIFVTGRLKDRIILNGRNLHPGDIEDVCLKVLPAGDAGAVAAVGIDRGDEEHIAVFVEVAREDGADRERLAAIARTLRDACLTQLGVPVREVAFVPARRLPRTTSGKIRRLALRRKHEAGEIVCLERSIAGTAARRVAAPPGPEVGFRKLPRSVPALMRRVSRVTAHAIRRPGEAAPPGEAAAIAPYPGIVKEVRSRWRRWRYLAHRLGMRLPRPRRSFMRHVLCCPPVVYIERARRWCVAEQPLETLASWIDFSGLEALDRHRDEKDPVILVASHFGPFTLVPVLLARRGFQVGSVGIGQLVDRDFSHVPGLTPVVVDRDHPARAAVECRRVLARGGVVHIVADGQLGKQDVPVRFHGIDRGFASGFASLAIATGIAARPIFALMDAQGRLRFELGDPLDPGVTHTDPRDRIEKMVRDYAGILEKYWRRFPSHADFLQMRTLIFPSGGTDDGLRRRDPRVDPDEPARRRRA